MGSSDRDGGWVGGGGGSRRHRALVETELTTFDANVCPTSSPSHLQAKKTVYMPYNQSMPFHGNVDATKWPLLSRVVGPWPPRARWESQYSKGEAPPIAVAQQAQYSWLARNLAWNGAHFSFEDITTAFTAHVKDPANVALRDTGYLYANCYRLQHNLCLSQMECRATFDKDGRLQAGCGNAAPALESAAVPKGRVSEIISEALPYIDLDGVDGCDKGGEFQCECWNCTCQGASNAFGVRHGRKGSFLDVPPGVKEWWTDERCRTKPLSYSGTMLKLQVAAFDKSVCPQISSE